MANEVFIVGYTTQLRAVLIGILTASTGATVIKYLSFGNLSYMNVSAISVPLVLGAFMFGLGMTLAGCCASGMFVRLAEGNTAHIVTVLFVFLGYFFANSHFESVWSDLIAKYSVTVYLPDMFGWVAGIIVHVVIVLLVYAPALRHERKRLGEIVLNDSNSGWRYTTGAVILGIITFLSFTILKNGPTMMGAFYIISEANWTWENMGNVMFDVAVFTGALLSVAIYRGIKFNKIMSVKQVLPAAIGGCLMGYGARIADGCNISAFFAAASALSLSGWAYMIFLFVGVFIGLKVLNKFFV